MKDKTLICVGLPKSGSTSMKGAAAILGYEVGKVKNMLHGVPGSYVGDFTALPLDRYKELDEIYPDAKFVMTLRKDPATWFRSLYRWAKKKKDNEGIIKQRKSMYGVEMPNQTNKPYLINVYVSRKINVKKYFQNKYGDQWSDKLLFFCPENGDGWEKLCSFLGIDNIPEVDYPHHNKQKYARSRTKK